MDASRDRPVQVKIPFTSGNITDTRSYALSLREIDQMRVDGKFVDAEGNKAEGQYVSVTNLATLGSTLIDRPCCSSCVGVMA